MGYRTTAPGQLPPSGNCLGGNCPVPYLMVIFADGIYFFSSHSNIKDLLEIANKEIKKVLHGVRWINYL